MPTEKVKKNKNLDPAKIEKCLGEMIESLEKNKLTVGELIILLSNLQYTIGASIDGYGEKGPGLEELKKIYYSEPTVGVAMMLNGMEISTWYDSWVNILKKKKDNKENT